MIIAPPKPKPATPRRTTILSAANKVFVRFGYTAASVRAIASEAQVSLTLLSHHFGTKAGLLAGVLDMHSLRFAARAEAIHAAQTSQTRRPGVEGFLEAWLVTELRDAATEDGGSFRMLTWRMLRDPDIEAVAVARKHASLVTEAFSVAVRNSERSVPDKSAKLLWGVVEGALAEFAARALSEAEPDADREAARAIVNAFIVEGVQAAVRTLHKKHGQSVP